MIVTLCKITLQTSRLARSVELDETSRDRNDSSEMAYGNCNRSKGVTTNTGDYDSQLSSQVTLQPLPISFESSSEVLLVRVIVRRTSGSTLYRSVCFLVKQVKHIILNKTKNIKSTALHRLIVWKYKTERTVRQSVEGGYPKKGATGNPCCTLITVNSK